MPAEPLIPRRSSLLNDCIRVLRARIEAGEWVHTLPGERRLAEILNVGRDTIRLTLAELAAQGVIEAGAVGRQRRILAQPKPAPTPEADAWHIGFLAPVKLERLPQSTLTEVDQIRTILAQRGAFLDLHAPPWYDSPNPVKRLEAMIKSEPCNAWILYRSSRQIQEFFQSSRIPCVIRGYPHPGIELPYLDYDWMATGRHAVGELWRKGHRHIAILVPLDGMRGNTAAIQGAESFTGGDVKLTQIPENGTSAGLIQAVSPVLSQADPPTAFITIRPRQAVTLLTWLGSRSLRVPRDFSLISLATEPVFDHIVPAITTYRIEAAVFARRVAKLLELLVEGSATSHSGLLLMPDLVAGASIAQRA